MMEKIFVLILALCRFNYAYSQDYIKEIQRLTLANDSLQKQVVKPLQDSILKLNSVNSGALLMIQKQINALQKDTLALNNKIKNLEKIIADLNKNNVKIERDNLRKQVESLTATIAELNKRDQEKTVQIAEAKRNGEQNAKTEKENGKKEILENVLNIYMSSKLDDLIKISTNLSVQRDIQFAGNNEKAKSTLSSLEKYYNAEELLTKKIETAQIKNAMMQLNQINQPSELLGKLKENLELYQDFTDELRKTIEKLIDLDKKMITASDPVVQKQKLNLIVSELSTYMYNYYDYSNYPYLFPIVLEIVKRKRPNADADITDLLKKLQ